MMLENIQSKLKEFSTHLRRSFESRPPLVSQELHRAVNAGVPERYDPRIIAKGGEHMVFRFNEPFRRKLMPEEKEAGKKAKERLRDVVYKVNYQDTAQILEAVASGDDLKVKKALEKMREKIEDKRRSFEYLREYFGFDAVPAQQYMIRDVPITPEIVAAVKPGLIHKAVGLTSIPAWVEVQRKLDLDTAISVNGYYPESPHSQAHEKVDEKEFNRKFDAGHDVLTGGILSEMDHESQLKRVLAMYPDLRPVAHKAAADPSFKEELRQLSDKLMNFIEETGIAIDLVGRNNMVMIKRGDKWTVRFLDILHPGDFSFINLKILLEMMRQKQPIGQRGRSVVLDLVNTVRIVNALALISGNDRRLYYPDLAAIPPEVWRDEMKKAFVH
jgi:hypothetical protein